MAVGEDLHQVFNQRQLSLTRLVAAMASQVKLHIETQPLRFQRPQQPSRFSRRGDVLAEHRGSPHPEAARAFIDYMLRPESIAALTNSLFFANANKAANSLIDEAVTSDPDIYPPQDVRARLFSEQLMPLNVQRDRTRLWNTFRTKT